MINKLLLIIYIFTIFILLGCSNSEQINKAINLELSSDEVRVSKKYLEEQGYKVISYENLVFEYILTEELIKDIPYSIYWSLPGNDPNELYGEMVKVHKFIVTNHPLDNYKIGDFLAKGKTEVYVYIVNGKVVGGNSFPVMDNGYDGGYWNIIGEK